MEHKIRFLHTADLHLGAAGAPTANIANQRQNEAILTLERLFSLCRDNDIPLMLIAGDLLENNSVEPKFFESFLQTVASHPQIITVFAAGNHDPLTADSPFLNYQLPENLVVLKTEDDCIELENLPVRIYGKSFGSVYMTGENNFTIPAKNDEKLNIMVLHADLNGDSNGNYNTITNSFIEASNMDYIALGHIHAFSAPQKLGNSYYAYSGTPEPHGFDELGEKGVITGEISKSEFRYRFVPTGKRRYEMVETDISSAGSSVKATEIILEKLSELFNTSYENNLYKIILSGDIPSEINIDSAEICTRLAEKLYYVKVIDKTKPLTNLEILKKENSLKGKFVKLMCEKIETADETEKQSLKNALDIGLKAFYSEVKYYEN